MRSTQRFIMLAGAVAVSVAFTTYGHKALASDYFNGFETDNSGWDHGAGNQYTATRVASGTDGIASATGSFHAEVGQYDLDNQGGSAYTNWGGYQSSFASTGYKTSLDIYLNMAGGWTNDTRLDWSSAICDNTGGYRRDFVFNGGFYNDSDTTGTGNRFVFSASNNAGRGGAYPKNPGRDPFSLTITGWYTFQHSFYETGGVLAVDLSILDSGANLLHTWTLSDPSDTAAVIGGNRYGWMAANEFSVLAIDNSSRTSTPVPEPASLAAIGIGMLVLIRRKRTKG